MKLTTKIIVLIGLTVLFKLDILAQEIIPNDTTVYYSVDEFPILITSEREYKQGEIQEYVKQNLKYPTNGLDCIGKVYISFVVETDGTISNKKFIRKLCPGFDENAMELVDSMTTWKPGMKNNKPVRTHVPLAISWKSLE